MQKPKVFLSWSGPDALRVAEAWRDWLPLILTAVDPWMSGTDIEKGTRWANEISKQLERSSVGILFVTRQGIDSPWLHFEAGALAKIQDKALVCTYLVDVRKEDLEPPLSMFQATLATESDTLALLKTINGRLGALALRDKQLESVFGREWHYLKGRIEAVPRHHHWESLGNPDRPTRDLVVEILELVRSNSLVSDPLLKEIKIPATREGNFGRDLVRLFAVAMDLGWHPHDPKILEDLTTMVCYSPSCPGPAAGRLQWSLGPKLRGSRDDRFVGRRGWWPQLGTGHTHHAFVAEPSKP